MVLLPDASSTARQVNLATPVELRHQLLVDRHVVKVQALLFVDSSHLRPLCVLGDFVHSAAGRRSYLR